MQIHGVVRRLRNPPRHSAARAVPDLLGDDAAVGLGEQAPFRRIHDQSGHQVLEHRPAQERRAAPPHRRQRATEAEPVRRRHLAAGDGEETREAALGREQVVGVDVEGRGVGVEPN